MTSILDGSPDQITRAEEVVYTWPEFGPLDEAAQARVVGRLVRWQIMAPLDYDTSVQRETTWSIAISPLEPAVEGLAIHGIVKRLDDGSVNFLFERIPPLDESEVQEAAKTYAEANKPHPAAKIYERNLGKTVIYPKPGETDDKEMK